ncbi:MAG: serine/threonine protein kinase, partial [Myxococcales bacterium]|nr:serine/threonine protein kinase [Myxococcales bacterium]
MRRVEGREWSLTQQSGETLEHHLRVLTQVCHAVQFAHTRGLVHLDLKPSNVMLGSYGEIYLLDWGIAVCVREDLPEFLPRARDIAAVLGTPAYMAPEQIAGSPAPSPATDVFALGAVIYEMVTGERAYPSPRMQETIRAKLRGELPELRTPTVPGGSLLLDMVQRCLAKSPELRPTLVEVREVLNELLRLASGDIRTDMLDLPTMGLTSAQLLPAAAATELSEVPPAALVAAQRALALGSALEAETESPELMHLMGDVEDEDDLGTELVRPSLDHLPAMAGPTDQVTPRGIPAQHTLATQRVLAAITDEVPPVTSLSPLELHTTPSAVVRGGLMGPVGVSPELDPELHTRTNPSQEAVEPPALPPTRIAAPASAITEPPPARAQPSAEGRARAAAVSQR